MHISTNGHRPSPRNARQSSFQPHAASYGCPKIQWPCNRNRLIGGTYHLYKYIYKAYFSGLNFRNIYPQFIWSYMLQYLHFRTLKVPLILLICMMKRGTPISGNLHIML